MVKCIFFINCYFLIVYPFSVYAQADDFNSLLITVIDEPVYYIGGVDSMRNFVAKNLKYPQSAIQDKIEGTVFVEFWIDVDGATVDHSVIRGVRNDLNEEAIRVLKLLVFSQPAKQKGKPIKSHFVIPVKFELPETRVLKEENLVGKKKQKSKITKNK